MVVLSVCALCVFFFFFQAEDGIRDHCVTGVQTCALRSLAAWFIVKTRTVSDRLRSPNFRS